MSVLGKVLNWMVVPLAIAAIILTSQSVDIHHQWMRKVAERDKIIKDNADKIAARRADLAQVQAEYDRTMLGWGQYWTDVTGNNFNAAGQIVLGIGPPDLNDKDPQGNPMTPVVFAFQELADGTYDFVGEFKAGRLGAGQSTFQPTWRVRPDETKTWRAGPNWRLRSLIPDAEKARFTDLEVQLIIADEFLEAKKRDLERQDEVVKLAEDQLNLRKGEIEGFADLQGKNLPPEIIQGVLAALVEEEEARNAALEGADDLRRELRKSNLAFDQIRALNLRLTRSLKAAPAVEPAAKVSQR